MTSNRPGHPHASSAIARFLDKRIEELRGYKTQREIAAAAGYARPNILSMLKSGETKVSLARVPALAKALETDPVHLFRIAMTDQWPELASVIDDIFGRHMASANEFAILLKPWRAASADMDPAPNARVRGAIDEMLSSLKNS
jgi:transcriptional regulator with XRE-family HTH domain